MTHTDPTAAGLLAGVLARPECDTARLVYADRLTEIAGSAPCPECKGRGLLGGIALTPGKPCERCGAFALSAHSFRKGTGTVSDGRAERAEFIRVQCDLDRGILCGKECSCERVCARKAGRERALLTDNRRREWARVPWGAGGKSDAFDVCEDTVQRDMARATPHFERGFVARVEVPALSWVIERCEAACPECSGVGRVPKRRGERTTGGTYRCAACNGSGHAPPWRVTDWALAVARTHPVTEWVIGDKEPAQLGGKWGWWENGAEDRHQIGRLLWLAMYEPNGVRREWHDTREAALHALALAAGAVVREAVRATEGRT